MKSDTEKTTTEQGAQEVREKAAKGICHLCDQPVTVHDGSHVTPQAAIPAIQDAVDHENRHPGNSARDGNVTYLVKDAYYPGDYSHLIDLSDVDPEMRHSASIGIMGQLSRRGLGVNSVYFDPPRLHVMAVGGMSYGFYGGAEEP